ncbi:phosphoglucomutase [Paenibacillus sp. NFR01]|uniref:phosphoglucomutase n=1 Tax=Paenibacillus sp. NFR01 TaxID=1566279 RepID=UPI0008B9B1D4|nr:phosphoglucomutase [Paenibacillus sp. NFR01]SEU26577.1 hypothetical protein SAMN03159358_4520 [Paenibacillus sp. NFR01]
MPYPGQIDVFKEKLNKRANGGTYVIEEKIQLKNGAYNGFLAHDNINSQTITVFTGPGYSGTELRNFAVSFPDEAPWKRLIAVYAQVPEVYVTYETPGDTVEAEDINVLQTGLTAVQNELERYKSVGLIDGGTFKKGV